MSFQTGSVEAAFSVEVRPAESPARFVDWSRHSHGGRMCSLLPFQDDVGLCDLCGSPLFGKRRRWCSSYCNKAWVRQHRWTQARRDVVKRDGHRCVTCGSGDRLEVNHIVPRNGGGYGFGCWHHHSNLETLCHDCHVVVTREQRVARRLQAVHSDVTV